RGARFDPAADASELVSDCQTGEPMTRLGHVTISFCVVAFFARPVLTVAQAPAFTQATVLPGPANLVEVQGKIAYVVGGKTLTLSDIPRPAPPAKLGEHAFPEKIWGIRIVGPLVYAAADFYGLGIVDVSDPKAPVLRGSIKTPGQAKNVAVVGQTAL